MSYVDSTVLGKPATKPPRDPRVDVLRGIALLMIFVDHIPADVLNRFTMHDFGFADAAEVFVLLAGFSAMVAYGSVFTRQGLARGVRRIALRCLRIYLFQLGLLAVSEVVVWAWITYFQLPSRIVARVADGGISGVVHVMTLRALPGYLDILPLYIVLLAIFPLVYLAARRSIWLALSGSVAVWTFAWFHHGLNLPNWIDGAGWYFNPFSWQLVFVVGVAFAILTNAAGGRLPQRRWLVVACTAYLLIAFLEAAPWQIWGLPNLSPWPIEPPDKSHLSPLRLIDILAVMYLLLSSSTVLRLAQHRWARPLALCGKHSLEVFTLGCVVSMTARLVFLTFVPDPLMLVAINVIGFGAMSGLGWLLESAPLPRPAQRVDPVSSAPAWRDNFSDTGAASSENTATARNAKLKSLG